MVFRLCTWQCNLNCSCLRIWLHFTRRCPWRSQRNEFTRTKRGQQGRRRLRRCRQGAGKPAAFPPATATTFCASIFFSASTPSSSFSHFFGQPNEPKSLPVVELELETGDTVYHIPHRYPSLGCISFRLLATAAGFGSRRGASVRCTFCDSRRSCRWSRSRCCTRSWSSRLVNANAIAAAAAVAAASICRFWPAFAGLAYWHILVEPFSGCGA